jgi:UDP-N-acetylmuramoyl-L-alanyl-D-glutamate--2,6-diaminopimelate ligase
LALEDRIGQDVEISSLTCDTRTLVPGGLFVALKGSKEDGDHYIDEALGKGAAAVVCREPPDRPGPWLVSRDPRGDYARLCASWFDHPGDGMTLLAVTGTNGKTTTTYLLKWVLEQCLGAKVGLIGTNQDLIGAEALPASRTTPDPYVLQCLLARMKRAGCSHVVMEVSSHALALERTAGLTFRVGIFTNLTRDHLDFHGTVAAYRQAKGKLFAQCQAGCFNLDDATGRAFAQTSPCKRITFGSARREGDLRAGAPRLRPDGVTFSVEAGEERATVSVPIPGAFTVSNALGAMACGRELGLPLEDMAAALASTPGVKGRAEVVPVPAPYTVLIDYAHTPDALEKILTAARQGATGRLICLFGCGGDRDRTKRPIMGEIASALADFVILTSDNPRTEDPDRILDQVAAGFPRAFRQVLRQPDRRAAIRAALAMGQAGDVILLAGKGHETYQEIGTKRIHLDEREEIASFFLENRV